MRTFNLSILFILSFLLTNAQEEEQDVLRFSMETRWTDQVDQQQPWNKYPRPQMVRDNWRNLNGMWDYAIRSVEEDIPSEFDGEILVPFPVESSLSQVKKMVGEDNFLWYKTTFDVEDIGKDEKLNVNFGAVDWEAKVYLNGKLVGGHKGGYTPFSLDLTPYLKEGEQELVVRVWDPTDKGSQARGKQVQNPRGIWYTPVTGIWQTVWLETVRKDHFKGLRITPDIDQEIMRLNLETSALSEKLILNTTILDNGKVIAESSSELSPITQRTGLTLGVPNMKLWSPEDPFLYDLNLTLETPEGKVVDEVKSYFGMRKISLGKDANGYTRIMLNNLPYFQFGLLDQGWWPDGLYTPSTEEAMLYDVKMTQKMGFNMLRKHVKVEPARFYYHCDRMGVLVWQDMPNGNYFRDLRIQAWEKEDAKRSVNSSVQFENELKEMMDYFHSFPSIVAWVPFNEGWGQYETERVTKWVSAYDPSRIVDSPSGWTDRGVGDIIDTHIYPGPGMEAPEKERASVIGEFGGLGLTVEGHMWWDKKNWGYLTYSNAEQYEKRFEQLIEDLVGLKSFGLSAAIYTQTTDVEGEVNGLLTYDREVLKVDPEKTRKLFAPLYEPVHDRRILLKDAEAEPTFWKIKHGGNNSEDWKKTAFDDNQWQEKAAPFSSYDNFFLEEGTFLPQEKTHLLRKEFYITAVPAEIDLKYYLDKAEMKIFINGSQITSEKFQGGRKRHYRNKAIGNADTFLKKGKNVIAVEIEGQEREYSFDLGIFSTSPVKTRIEPDER